MIFRRALRDLAVRGARDPYARDIGSRFASRELSWLAFNERVLGLAADPDVPLLERCKFSSIFSTNLDEFFQIRVAALKDQVAADILEPSPDGRTPRETLAEISRTVQRLSDTQQTLWSQALRPELAVHDVVLERWDDLPRPDRERLGAEFERRIFPVLTPLSVDPSHPFPYISNLALNLAVVARNPRSGEERFARLKVPRTLPRFVPVDGATRFVLLEDLISAHLDRLFRGMEILTSFTFRVTRNADLSLDDEDAEDLLAAVEMELRRRRFGRAVRLEVPAGVDARTLGLMREELEIEEQDVTTVRDLVDASALAQLAALDVPHLRYRPWSATTAGRLTAAELSGRSIFEVVRERQLLVHHPYESFASSTEAFVGQAATDPRVQSIKMTLYRTSGDSAIARHLVRAAEAGKQVAVVLELKARFDEARNIAWARELEYAGVHVNYGIVGLKTHAKCVLVVRDDGDELRRYVHLGTGNYNPITARIYEDIGFFTCEDAIGRDATELFNYLTGYSDEPDYCTLFVAPHQLRPRMLELIHREATFGERGRITLKLNSISDPAIIDALYAASAAGTRVEVVVRGICCMRVGVPDLSERVHVRSILGRYLEHSRIFRFDHGTDDTTPIHLIGSADMMGRNLDRRVETLVPLTHPKHRAWLDRTLEYLLDDEVVHFALLPDGSWQRRGAAGFMIDAQQRLHDWAVSTQVR
jgi:polyphosphate kinase